jgi:TPR repeat protein
MGQRISRHLMITMLAISLIVSGGVVFAGPLEDGLAVYDHGDYATALPLLRPLAQQGDARAQFDLGSMYDLGNGVPQDFKEAMKWYRLAAAQGDSQAQTNLGLMYVQGNGVPQDFAQAMKWFRLAAIQGFSPAQFDLGLLYEHGNGVPQDFVRAHMWFNLAAARGDAKAVKRRDDLSKVMNKEQIAEAQAMAKRCASTNFMQCDEASDQAKEQPKEQVPKRNDF